MKNVIYITKYSTSSYYKNNQKYQQINLRIIHVINNDTLKNTMFPHINLLFLFQDNNHFYASLELKLSKVM